MRSMLVRWSRRRYACLLASLLLTLGARPMLEALEWRPVLLEALLAVNLGLAIVGSASERGFRLRMVLGALALLAGAVGRWLGGEPLLGAGEAAWALVAGLVLGTILIEALRSGAVDGERISAALSAYLLFGLLCAVVYVLIDRTWAGSFVAGGAPLGSQFALGDAIYFSFVTLATLGYGDVVPLSATARAIAIVEAIAGQFYLVVLVARLVSQYSARETRDPER